MRTGPIRNNSFYILLSTAALQGARNIRPNLARISNYSSAAISRSKVIHAIGAYDYASAIQRPLNVTMDIHWAFSGFCDGARFSRREAVAALLASQRHWLNYHGVGFYSIMVREAPPASEQGEHAHQLVHVPVHIAEAFEAHTRQFLRCGKRLRNRALKAASVYSVGKLAYMLKAGTPPARLALAALFKTDYERRHFLASSSQQGEIQGKRVLISEALGPKARQNHALAFVLNVVPARADLTIKQVAYNLPNGPLLGSLKQPSCRSNS